jgi:hypothetical protein
MSKLQDDRRIDPRIKAAMAAFPSMTQSDVRSRDELIAERLQDWKSITGA